jgi:transposase
MDGVMFLKWVENSLIPCFKARYPGKKMILMLDGASYHLIRDRNDGTHFLPRKNTKQVCITKLNELSIADSNSAGLHFEFTRPADKNDLSKGVKKYIACDKAWRESNSVMDNSDVSIVDFSKTGTPNVNEIQEFTHKYIKQNHPSLLENDLDRLLREKCDGSYSLVTPPYSPKFQPMERVWSWSKNFVAELWFQGRTPKNTFEQMVNVWYGGVVSKGTKIFDRKSPTGLTRERTLAFIRQCKEDMDIWINKNGCRCSGSILQGTFKHNSEIQYPDDGTVLVDDDEQEEEFDNANHGLDE